MVVSEQEWDVLIFTQHWPYTVCMAWEEKGPTNHTCRMPHEKDTWTVHGIWSVCHVVFIKLFKFYENFIVCTNINISFTPYLSLNRTETTFDSLVRTKLLCSQEL